MKQKSRSAQPFTAQEAQLLEQLRQHPEIMARVHSILEIVRSEEGALKTADQVEELLIQEIRQLGQATMSQWAAQAEPRVSTELKDQDPTVRSRKKKR
jgi:hypothetical protein